MNTLLQQGRSTVRDEGCKTLGYGRHIGDESRDGEMAVSVTTVTTVW
jgi:hypothetical protein